MTHIQAVLLDIDGTLTWQGRAIPGAAAALAYLHAQRIPCQLLTNISARLPVHIAADLREAGIDVAPEAIQTAATACADYVRTTEKSINGTFLPATIRPFFDGIRIDNNAPDLIVVGDAGAAFSFDNMNAAFKRLYQGAALIAMQKNLYWFTPTGVQLDCGTFVTALEAAAGVTATVTGKPAQLFFDAALARLGLLPENVLVVGDDATTDLAGARNVGARCALVRTGKNSAGITNQPQPDFTLDSIAQLPALLAGMRRG